MAFSPSLGKGLLHGIVIWLRRGATSIGFAVMDHDPGQEAGKIHRLGVRIFPEGTDMDLFQP